VGTGCSIFIKKEGYTGKERFSLKPETKQYWFNLGFLRGGRF
jgi:hypothetical protein